jgi:hypothetical protein
MHGAFQGRSVEGSAWLRQWVFVTFARFFRVGFSGHGGRFCRGGGCRDAGLGRQGRDKGGPGIRAAQRPQVAETVAPSPQGPPPGASGMASRRTGPLQGIRGRSRPCGWHWRLRWHTDDAPVWDPTQTVPHHRVCLPHRVCRRSATFALAWRASPRAPERIAPQAGAPRIPLCADHVRFAPHAWPSRRRPAAPGAGSEVLGRKCFWTRCRGHLTICRFAAIMAASPSPPCGRAWAPTAGMGRGIPAGRKGSRDGVVAPKEIKDRARGIFLYQA